jgi:hypothetical protein
MQLISVLLKTLLKYFIFNETLDGFPDFFGENLFKFLKERKITLSDSVYMVAVLDFVYSK